MKKLLCISTALAVVDQVIKAHIRTKPLGSVWFSMPPFFELTHTTNSGAAFSALSDHPYIVLILALALIVWFTFVMLHRLHLTPFSKILTACAIGGGLGNLFDRLFVGGVTDYIRVLFVRFPVFNFADILLTFSVLLMIVLLLTGRLELTTERKH